MRVDKLESCMRTSLLNSHAVKWEQKLMRVDWVSHEQKLSSEFEPAKSNGQAL